jgi:uncharacterized membrane protein
LSKKPAGKSPDTSQDAKPPDQALQEQIEREIGSLVPQGQRTQIVARLTRVVSSNENFSGPIAHPKHFREYEEILPGSAERIISMAESAQAHNQDMERAIVQGSIRTSRDAMYLGYSVLLILICSGFYAGLNGNNILAGLLLGTGILGGAATLIRGGSIDSSNPDKA